MTRRTILAAGAGLLALAAVALAPLARADELPMLTPDQVEKLLGKPGVKVLDANVPGLWEKHHVPGATFIGDSKLAGLLPADKETQLVFYCSGPK
jgi:rhodanese-related sulfurtransferase